MIEISRWRARSAARRAAGDLVAILTLFTLCTTLAPIIAGPVPASYIPHVCPWPKVVHGVGGNLKTYAKKVDLCARNK